MSASISHSMSASISHSMSASISHSMSASISHSLSASLSHSMSASISRSVSDTCRSASGTSHTMSVITARATVSSVLPYGPSVIEAALQAVTSAVSIASTVAAVGGGDPSLATLTMSLSAIHCNNGHEASPLDAAARGISILWSFGFLGIAVGNILIAAVVVLVHIGFIVAAYASRLAWSNAPRFVDSLLSVSGELGLRFPSLSILVVELLLPGSVFGAMAAIVTGGAGAIVGGVVIITVIAATVVFRQYLVLYCIRGNVRAMPYSAAVVCQVSRSHCAALKGSLLPAVYWEPASLRSLYGSLFLRYDCEANILVFSGLNLVISIVTSIAAVMAMSFGVCKEIAVVLAILLLIVSGLYSLKRPKRCMLDNVVMALMYVVFSLVMVLAAIGDEYPFLAVTRQWLQLIQWSCVFLKGLSFVAVAYWERTMTVLMIRESKHVAIDDIGTDDRSEHIPIGNTGTDDKFDILNFECVAAVIERSPTTTSLSPDEACPFPNEGDDDIILQTLAHTELTDIRWGEDCAVALDFEHYLRSAGVLSMRRTPTHTPSQDSVKVDLLHEGSDMGT